MGVIAKLLDTAIDSVDEALESAMKTRARVSAPVASSLKRVEQVAPAAHPITLRAPISERNWHVTGTIQAGAEGKAWGQRAAEQLFGARGDSMHFGATRTARSIVDGSVR